METSSLPVKGCKFDLCSVLMANEQWGFLSVPLLLWHGASDFNDHLRGPVTHLLPSVCLSRLRFEHQTFCLRGKFSNPLHHRRGAAVLRLMLDLLGRNSRSICWGLICSAFLSRSPSNRGMSCVQTKELVIPYNSKFIDYLQGFFKWKLSYESVKNWKTKRCPSIYIVP